MVKMVLFFGIVFFVCCTLSLTQGYNSEDEPIRRSILPPHGYLILTARREYPNTPYALIVNPEILEAAEDKIPFEVLQSLIG